MMRIDKNLLAVGVVGFAMMSAATVQAALVEGDVAYRYSFEGNSVGGASLAGGAAYTSTNKVGSTALDLATVGSYVDLTSEAAPADFQYGFTAAVWIRPDAAGHSGASQYARIFSTRSPSNTGLEFTFEPTLSTNGTTTSWGLRIARIGASNLLSANDVVSIGQWQHVAFSVSELSGGSATYTIYLNGQQIATDTVVGGHNTNSLENFYLGAMANTGDTGVDGLIDEAVLFNRELTPTEVNDFYTNLGGDAGLIPEPSSLALLGLGGLMLSKRRRRA